MIALEVLLLLLGLVAAILVYRGLVHSKAFTKLVGGILNVPPETPDEVIADLDRAENAARQRAQDGQDEVARMVQTLKTLKRRTPRT